MAYAEHSPMGYRVGPGAHIEEYDAIPPVPSSPPPITEPSGLNLQRLSRSPRAIVTGVAGAVVAFALFRAAIGPSAETATPAAAAPSTPEPNAPALVAAASPDATSTPPPIPTQTPAPGGFICVTTDRSKPDTSKACANKDGDTYFGADAVVDSGPGQGIPIVTFLPNATPLPRFHERFPDPNAVIASEGRSNNGVPVFYKPAASPEPASPQPTGR